MGFITGLTVIFTAVCCLTIWALYTVAKQKWCKHDYQAYQRTYPAYTNELDLCREYGRIQMKCTKCGKTGYYQAGPTALERIEELERELNQALTKVLKD